MPIGNVDRSGDHSELLRADRVTKDRSTSADQDDVEDLADALLAAVQQDADNPVAAEPRVPDAFSNALVALRRLGTEFVRRYNRLELETEPTTFDGPVLFVANHGFGGIFARRVQDVMQQALTDMTKNRTPLIG